MTPAEVAEVYRPQVERLAQIYRGRGSVVLPSQIDQAVNLAVAWTTTAQQHGADLVDLADLAGQALDTLRSAELRRQAADFASAR